MPGDYPFQKYMSKAVFWASAVEKLNRKNISAISCHLWKGTATTYRFSDLHRHARKKRLQYRYCRTRLEYCVQFWFLWFKKEADRLERVQKRAVKMIKELENLPFEEMLEELFFFTLEKRRLMENLMRVSQYLKSNCNKDRGSPSQGDTWRRQR